MNLIVKRDRLCCGIESSNKIDLQSFTGAQVSNFKDDLDDSYILIYDI